MTDCANIVLGRTVTAKASSVGGCHRSTWRSLYPLAANPSKRFLQQLGICRARKQLGDRRRHAKKGVAGTRASKTTARFIPLG